MNREDAHSGQELMKELMQAIDVLALLSLGGGYHERSAAWSFEALRTHLDQHVQALRRILPELERRFAEPRLVALGPIVDELVQHATVWPADAPPPATVIDDARRVLAVLGIDPLRPPPAPALPLRQGEAFRYAEPRARTMLAVDLCQRFDHPGVPGGNAGPGGWWILALPALDLGGEVLVPDLGGWQRTGAAAPPWSSGGRISPDWICEVLTPETQALDRGTKMKAYAQAEVACLWLLDPLTRTLEVYARADQSWALTLFHQGGGSVCAPPFAAVALEPARWWLDVG